MANLLAKVGRNPKTCATQITTFCSGGVTGTTGSGKGKHNRQLSRDSGENDDGEEKHEVKHHKGGRGGLKSGKRGSGGWDNDEDTALNRNRNHGRVGFAVPSTTSLAEFLAFFGFAFEATGAAVKPSVAEAFAMLRLHAQPTEVRAAGEVARRCTNTLRVLFLVLH